jgi:Putative Flp pilus-assembly TadE/G-like
MNRFRDQRGQALVMSIAFLTVLVGCAALVLDVGSWYRADRHAQTTADAAALAGAQGLQTDASTARSLAIQYADKNDGGVTPGDVSVAADTVRVNVNRPAPGFFAKLFGLDSVRAHAVAAARIGTPAEALYVAPIVVNEKHPDLENFGKPTELEYYHLTTGGGGGGGGGGPKTSGPDGPGSFGFISLDGSDNPGTSTMGDWIQNGFDKYMKLGEYDARTGNPFSSSHISDSLADKLGEELLFPIYRKLTETGSNAKYEIIGWVGFHLTGTDLHGSSEKLHGWFTRVIWEGVQGHSGSSYSPGVGVIELVE